MAADFRTAYEPVRQWEGTYSNDKTDRGGETFCGIARNFFPNWPGWQIIDREKSIAGGVIGKMIKALDNTNIYKLVQDWYREEWWNPLGLASLPQALANELFEQSVNLGKGGAGKKVQTVCNAFNYQGGEALFEDLKVDGAIGPKTLAALGKIISCGKADAESLVHALNCMQGCHYLELAAKKPSQRVFTKGWMTRTYDA